MCDRNHEQQIFLFDRRCIVVRGGFVKLGLSRLNEPKVRGH